MDCETPITEDVDDTKAPTWEDLKALGRAVLDLYIIIGDALTPKPEALRPDDV